MSSESELSELFVLVCEDLFPLIRIRDLPDIKMEERAPALFMCFKHNLFFPLFV